MLILDSRNSCQNHLSSKRTGLGVDYCSGDYMSWSTGDSKDRKTDSGMSWSAGGTSFPAGRVCLPGGEASGTVHVVGMVFSGRAGAAGFCFSGRQPWRTAWRCGKSTTTGRPGCCNSCNAGRARWSPGRPGADGAAFAFHAVLVRGISRMTNTGYFQGCHYFNYPSLAAYQYFLIPCAHLSNCVD